MTITICPKCSKEFDNYSVHGPKKFCSRACANSRQQTHAIQSKRSIKQLSHHGVGAEGAWSPVYLCTCKKCTKQFFSWRNKTWCGCIKPKTEYAGEYSTLYISKCRVCGSATVGKTTSLFCNVHKNHHSNKRAEFRFRFNVYDYPDLFDLELLAKVGFYAPKGKSGKWNPTGLSRDHKVSIADAIKFNYDPYYITHPLNCELMPHSVNGRKHSKSSISYEELVQRVNRYQLNISTGRVL